MSHAARFEICRGDAGWWARFRTPNSRVVFTSEVYTRKVGAENAIEALTGTFIYPESDGRRMVRRVVRMTNDRAVEVRYLDLRGGAS